MSLYNNVTDSLISKGTLGSLQGAANTALGNASQAAKSALGESKIAQVAANAGYSLGSQAVAKAISRNVPPHLRGRIDAAGRAIGSAMQGNWQDAALYGVEAGAIKGLWSNSDAFVRQERIRNTPTPLLGGVSLVDAQRITAEVAAANHSRKNIFCIELTSYAEGSFSQPFNLFCLDVDYAPFQVRGDKINVGGAVLDTVQGSEAVELRFVTYDNKFGDLKHFFARHHARAAARDGSVGLASEYALRIKIVDGVVDNGLYSDTSDGYTDIGLFRVTSLEKSLSRREQSLQELQLTFSQLDTFMRA